MPVFTQPAIQGKFVKGRKKRSQAAAPSVQDGLSEGVRAAKSKNPSQPAPKTKATAY